MKKLDSVFSTMWTPQYAARWEKIRNKGQHHFVFIRGAVYFGGLMIASQTLFHAFILPGHFDWLQFTLAFLFFPLGGVLWGIFLWNHLEAGYQSYQSRRELEQLEASQAKLTSKL
jgi:hypothetical protein